MNYVLEVIKETWPVILIMGVIAIPVLIFIVSKDYVNEDELNDQWKDKQI